VVPTVDDMLRYCRGELVNISISSPHSSAVAAGRWWASQSPEYNWHMTTVSDTDLQPTWVCHLDI